jgi:hypothetical protein
MNPWPTADPLRNSSQISINLRYSAALVLPEASINASNALASASCLDRGKDCQAAFCRTSSFIECLKKTHTAMRDVVGCQLRFSTDSLQFFRQLVAGRLTELNQDEWWFMC